MLVGHVDTAQHHMVSGWVADSEAPNRRIELEILVNGEICGRVIADAPRDDLLALGKYGDGQHGFQYYFDLPLTLIRDYSILLRDARTGQVIPGGELWLTRRQISAKDELSPVLVTATGRSGTTLLMRRLANHRRITLVEQLPYEMKLLSYYSKAFDVLTSPGNRERSVDPDHIYDDPFHLGLNPFHHHYFNRAFPSPGMLHEFFRETSAPIIANSFKEIVTRFYRQLAATQGKDQAIYFAEKCSVFDPVRNFVRSIYKETKEIVLVRDPRDTYCSSRAFWSERGEDALRLLRSVRQETMAIVQEKPPNVVFVRYEDLIQRAGDESLRISELLGLADPIAVNAQAEAAIFDSHATSRDQSASVGRWRSELTAEERAVFSKEFRDFLVRFNYDA